MTKHLYQIIVLAALISSCKAGVKTKINHIHDPLGQYATVAILYPSQEEPKAEKIGTFKTKEPAISVGCEYQSVLNMTLADARTKGCNLVHIEKIMEPSSPGSCYNFKGSYYYLPDVYAFQDSMNAIEDSITATKFAQDSSYTILHVYRPKSYLGSLIGYGLHQEEEEIMNVRNGTYKIFKIANPQCYRFWGKTENLCEMNLCFEPGEEYYLRCSIEVGVLIGRPRFMLVEKAVGRSETSVLQAE